MMQNQKSNPNYILTKKTHYPYSIPQAADLKLFLGFTTFFPAHLRFGFISLCTAQWCYCWVCSLRHHTTAGTSQTQEMPLYDTDSRNLQLLLLGSVKKVSFINRYF